MVDLGQKGWKKFHLFYFNKLGNKKGEDFSILAFFNFIYF